MGFLNRSKQTTQTVELDEQQKQIVRPNGIGVVKPMSQTRQNGFNNVANQQYTNAQQSMFNSNSVEDDSDEIDFGTDLEETDTTEKVVQEQPVQNQPVNVTPSKDDKQSNKDNKQAENAENAEVAKDLVLYMIIDKTNATMLGYFRDFGINISRIFTNIAEAKDTLLMQVNPVKILIVDTGTGRFSAIGARKEIIDLMGIVDDDARISVFYTDTVIRSEIKYNEAIESKGIHWHKYRSTVDLVAHLLMNKGKENYVYDDNDKEEVKQITDDVLAFRGMKFTGEDSIDIGLPSISLQDIMINMTEGSQDSSEEIPGYVIKV